MIGKIRVIKNIAHKLTDLESKCNSIINAIGPVNPPAPATSPDFG